MLTQRIENAIKKANGIKGINSCEEIFKLFENICFSFGIKHFSLAIFFGQKKLTESFYLYNTYSLKWQQCYIEKKYYLCDPTFRSLGKIAFPFEWSTWDFQDIFPLQQVLIREAHNFGIKSGMTIPLSPRSTFHGFLTVFNQISLHSDIVYALSLIADACVEKIIRIKEEKILDCLTGREKEVIFQKSQGLSVKRIGYKLDISSSSVAFHLANIRKKLRVKTSEHAVSKFLTHSINL